MLQNRKWWIYQPLGKYVVLHRNPFLGSNVAWLSYKERRQIVRIIEQSQSNSALCTGISHLTSESLSNVNHSWPTLPFNPAGSFSTARISLGRHQLHCEDFLAPHFHCSWFAIWGPIHSGKPRKINLSLGSRWGSRVGANTGPCHPFSLEERNVLNVY